MILAGDGPLGMDAFSLAPATTPRLTAEPVAADLNLDRVERRLVEEALKKHGYNISAAAH